MRNHKWLKNRLAEIWKRYFPDISISNNVIVRFGRPSKTRLGSIKYGRIKDQPNTIITINGHFTDPQIPEFVIDAVLAHELTHYAHGFFNPKGQQKIYPHKGGIVNKEMISRGLSDLLKLEKKWIKENWQKYLKNNNK